MTSTFKNKKIKKFIGFIESLEEIMVDSNLWNFTRTGLGEIGQGNLFNINNNEKSFNEINFARLIISLVTFFLIIIYFPIKYILYKFKCLFKINNSFNHFKTNKKLNIFVGPFDVRNNLKGSHEKIFLNLQKKYDDLILIPLKPLIFKNIFSLSDSNNKTINLSDIFLEKPSIFFSWIKEVFYIFMTLLKTDKEKLNGFKKFIIIISFIESSLRQSYEIYALINFLIYRLNKINVNFYSTFEANSFEKVLVKYRSNLSNYETFHVCAITDFHTKHNFYYRLIKEKGFPNKIYTPQSKLYNSSIFKYYSSIPSKIVKVNNSEKSEIKRVNNFKFKFALLCYGGFRDNYLLDFARQLLRYKICTYREIIVSLHPSVKMTNYSFKIIKKLGLERTTDLYKSINNSRIGIYMTSSSSINAIDVKMPLIKVINSNILDCDNPLESIKDNNKSLLKLNLVLKKDDLINLKKFLLIKEIQYRKSPDGWYYG